MNEKEAIYFTGLLAIIIYLLKDYKIDWRETHNSNVTVSTNKSSNENTSKITLFILSPFVIVFLSIRLIKFYIQLLLFMIIDLVFFTVEWALENSIKLYDVSLPHLKYITREAKSLINETIYKISDISLIYIPTLEIYFLKIYHCTKNGWILFYCKISDCYDFIKNSLYQIFINDIELKLDFLLYKVEYIYILLQDMYFNLMPKTQLLLIEIYDDLIIIMNFMLKITLNLFGVIKYIKTDTIFNLIGTLNNLLYNFYSSINLNQRKKAFYNNIMYDLITFFNFIEIFLPKFWKLVLICWGIIISSFKSSFYYICYFIEFNLIPFIEYTYNIIYLSTKYSLQIYKEVKKISYLIIEFLYNILASLFIKLEIKLVPLLSPLINYCLLKSLSLHKKFLHHLFAIFNLFRSFSTNFYINFTYLVVLFDGTIKNIISLYNYIFIISSNIGLIVLGTSSHLFKTVIVTLDWMQDNIVPIIKNEFINIINYVNRRIFDQVEIKN